MDSSEAVSPRGEAGAPEAEIEATPEMIKAGLNVIRYSYFSEGALGDADAELLMQVYRAMVLARVSSDPAS